MVGDAEDIGGSGSLAVVDGDSLRVLHRSSGIDVGQGGADIHTGGDGDLLGGAFLELARRVAGGREHRSGRDDVGVLLPQVRGESGERGLRGGFGWLHHDVGKKGEGMGEYLAGHADVEEVKKLVGKTFETYGEQDFVVFDGDGIRLLPFGRGNDYKLSLVDVVAYDVADPTHPTSEEVVRIAGRIDESVAPDSLPNTEFFSENPDKYPSLVGKRAGILVPYLRGSSTDLNMTLAIAIFAMVSVQFWGIKTLGIGGYWDKFIGNPFKRNPIDLFVGVLELVGEFIKIVSFTFRLFGNMFAGEILLIAMGFLFPLIGMIPFIGLELFVGFIQAIIFSVLTLMFGAFAIMPHHHPEGDHHGAEEGH